mgnify:CR=1 FL=1
MSQSTCPLTIVIMHPRNKSPVRAEECQAVVYWDRKGQYYYVRPVTAVGIRIRVHLSRDGRSFQASLYAQNFLRAFSLE